jgi:hypothetical protein
MYQRYFSYHDVGAAVHHCRIHVNSLKKYCSENSEYVWRKWHWLSLNRGKRAGVVPLNPFESLCLLV